MPGAGGGHPGALLPRAGALRGPRETCLGRETCFSRRRQSLSLSRTATVPTEHAPPPPWPTPAPCACEPGPRALVRGLAQHLSLCRGLISLPERPRGGPCGRLRQTPLFPTPTSLCVDGPHFARPSTHRWTLGAPPFGCCAASSGGVAVSLGTHVGSREAGGGCAEGRRRQSRDVRGSDDPAFPGSFTPSLGGPGLTGATGASLTARCPPGPCA